MKFSTIISILNWILIRLKNKRFFDALELKKKSFKRIEFCCYLMIEKWESAQHFLSLCIIKQEQTNFGKKLIAFIKL